MNLHQDSFVEAVIVIGLLTFIMAVWIITETRALGTKKDGPEKKDSVQSSEPLDDKGSPSDGNENR